MRRHIILVFVFVAFYSISNSQTTLILQPGSSLGKDCEIFSLQPSSNYVSNLLRGNAWTWSGTPGIERGLFEFDLSSVPFGSIIDSAYLDLFSPNAPNSEFHSGSNASFLKRITSDWNETTVTWNNQPSTTNVNQVALPMSSAPYQDYLHIAVTVLVKDMVDNPAKSFGFMIMQQVEQIRRRMTFCSSDYPDNSKHPKLVIYYRSQTCISTFFQPDAITGKDCEIFSLQPNMNYVSNLLRGNAWTWFGTPGIERGLFEFDLSSIPPGSTIESAYLDLYSPNPPSSEFHSGSNSAFLKRITSEWKETTVTWNNQPSTTNVNQVILAMSNAPYQDYLHIDVTQLVNDMVDNPSKSFGFMIMQQVEQIYRRMTFCSSDYPDSSKHPKLVVCYTPPTCFTVILQPDAAGKDCEIFSLQPNVNYVSNLLRGNAWTFSGKSGIERSLLDFDLSSIPLEAEITWAHLSLYAPDAPSTQFHSGMNESLIQRIITNWNESTVTWNTQPKTTLNHQVLLPQSTNQYQDYLNIDVTLLVQDMIDNPSAGFGFMLKLRTEKIYRRLSFCSSDYPNPNRHPKLEICYDYHPRSPDQENKIIPDVNIYPNPCNDWIEVKMTPYSGEFRIQILDFLGRIIYDKIIYDQVPIDMSELLPSIYIIRIIGQNNEVIYTTKVVKD